MQEDRVNLVQALDHAVARFGDQIAISGLQGPVTFTEFNRASDSVAAALIGMGMEKGQRVGLYCINSEAFAIAYFGIIKCGAIAVPVNLLLPAAEISYILNDAGVSSVIYHQLFAETVAGLQVPTLQQRIVIGEDATGSAIPFTSLLATEPERPNVAFHAHEDIASIIYTSGTTGHPKGAMLSHANLLSNAHSCRQALQLTPGTDAFLVVLPMFHSFAHTVGMVVPLLHGCRIVPVPKFDAQLVADTVEKSGATIFMGVPTMYAMLLTLDATQTPKFASLRYCIAGGAAMPMSIMDKFESRFGKLIYEGDGPTECSPVTCVNPIGGVRKPGSVGVPVPDVAMGIRNDQGDPVADNDIGEICVRGPNVMRGYWQLPEETAQVFFDDWYRTGDLGYRDSDGYFYIVDRLKDMLIVNGMNVYPKMVEDVLYQIPAVQEAAVVGQPDEVHGEIPVAHVVLREGEAMSVHDIVSYCKNRLAGFQVPRIIHFSESLPKTPTGKILKRELTKRGEWERGIKS